MCDEGVVEDVISVFHVILNCSKYSDLRQQVLNEIAGFNDNCNDMSESDQFKFILSNENCVRVDAKFLCDNVSTRSSVTNRN